MEYILDELNKVGGDRLNTGIMIRRDKILKMIPSVYEVMFPHSDNRQMAAFGKLAEELQENIAALCEDEDKACAKKTTEQFLEKLPEVKAKLLKDIEAIYDGDPAAKDETEVVLAYPGFYAIMIYRLAHELYLLKVPYVPRLFTEYAHARTGVDIHPGATIGEYFCIDHGTGVVIGETAVIGNRVKLYQGVTIGAKSFDMDENGNPVKGGKRHPDIEDNVVIYSNATILGGNTVIGAGSTIGGSAWITESVAPGSSVYRDCDLGCPGRSENE